LPTPSSSAEIPRRQKKRLDFRFKKSYYSAMNNSNSKEVERHCLAAVIKFPDLMAEINHFIKEDDFGVAGRTSGTRTIFSAMCDASKKGEDISPFSIAVKLSNSGITIPDLDIPVQEYLEGIKLIPISEKGGLQAFAMLKKISVRRELFKAGKEICNAQEGNGEMTLDEILEQSEQIFGSKLATFETQTSQMFEDVFGDIETTIEERGNNPIEYFGIKGPFPRINDIYGSLLRRGNISLIAARQNQGKTQFGQYYMMHAAQNYNLPVLHLDMGEMSKFELQIRAMALLTSGQVPPDMLETGSWRKNPETEALVRATWPKVNGLMQRYFYKDVSELTPDQILSVIKRFYWTIVKQRHAPLDDGLEFVIFYDYLKAFENNSKGESKYMQEYQLMGYFMQKIKRLIQNVVPASLWTSLQVNRLGITGNKSSDDIDDTENVFGLSDRIIQQATHAALLRRQTTDELAQEPNCGNYKLIFTKARHLGKDRDAHVMPVRMHDGNYKKNFIYLEGKNFCWREIGDLGTMKDQIATPPPADPKDEEERNAEL